MAEAYFRTFIGLPVRLNESFLGALKTLTGALEEERISWVRPQNFHITLRFLGNTPVSDVHEIHSALERVRLPEAWDAEICGPGSFGPHNKPRVIWTGFRDEEPIIRIKREVDRILGDLNYPPFEGLFTPHLTLGRIRGLKDREGYYSLLDSLRDRFDGSLEIRELVFYRSILESRGPEYSRLGEWKFGAWPRRGISPSGSRSAHHPS